MRLLMCSAFIASFYFSGASRSDFSSCFSYYEEVVVKSGSAA